MIEITNATKKYRDVLVLKRVNASLASGMIHGIIGKNGSGKTMLLKAICGIIRLTEGDIRVDGLTIGKDVSVAPDIGVIIETPGFLSHYSGYKNLKYLAELKRVASTEDIRNAMEVAGLDPNCKKPVGRYSLGMRQRLGIAQSIMEHPKLLLLDEPFNGLDNLGIADMYRLLSDFRNKGGTVVIASHSKEDTNALCDDVYTMDDGKMSRQTAV